MAIKIFSLAKWDYAACGFFLSEAINDMTEHHSRSARRHESLLDFPYDALLDSDRRIRALWEWADIIHIHDASGIENIMDWSRKPVVVTFHGTRYRNGYEAFHDMVKQRGWLGTVATPDLTQFGLPLLPDARPDLSDKVVDRHDQFTVCHAPTKRDVKGTDRVIAACKKVGVELDLIENMPWKKCIERKARCHILVDQFELGYGCNAIEAWSMGIPVISDGTDSVIDAIYGTFNGIPFVRPCSTLEDTIVNLRDDREAWIRAASVGHQHYLDYHSYTAVAKLASWVYGQAIEHFQTSRNENIKIEHFQTSRNESKKGMRPRVPALLQAEPLVLVRYLGKKSGDTKWFPGNGTRTTYWFSAKEPLRYVYESDVEWFIEQRGRGDKPMFAREGE